MNAHTSDAAPATRTTCPYCGVGCGVLARPAGPGRAAVEGDPEHPANRGRLCSKGSALGETVGLETRLLHPMRRGRRVPWTEALDGVSSELRAILDRHGPDSVAFYLSGQLLTEDYYVANKLMKGFIGSCHVDTNSRLCMASSVAGHRRAFGADTVPGVYEDLDRADLLVLVGSNAAWCHPILFRRMQDNRRTRGARIVTVDPRRTSTGDESDLFLGLEHGTDSVLFSGLLVHLAETGALDHAYLDAHTAGFEEALAGARRIAPSAAATARATGLTEGQVAEFFRLFRDTERVVTCYSQGVNQSAQGTDKVNAIINCHLATGRIGREGMGPFSLTGQPNAMGGREVGGLANMLAAHMGFTQAEVERVLTRFWRAPHIAAQEGLKAVAMFDAIARGRIKALWVMGTNPAVSLPEADGVREALAKLDLFVVSDNVASTDTVSRGADYLLPAAAWGEKDGTVTNSERRISRQRAFLPLPGEVRPDWWIMQEVARRLGFGDAFAYASSADIFREHARLSAFENDGERDFDLSGLVDLTDAEFDALEPVLWPVRAGEPRDHQPRFFAQGGFYTADKRGRLVAPAPPALPAPVSDRYPFRLNTGRVRDHWHTMTRTGLSPRLGSHRPVPFVEVNPRDAERLGLGHGDLARVTSASGEALLEVAVAEGQPPGTLFVPIHWNHETSSHGRVGPLVHAVVDPFSGQPDSKATPAAIEPAPMGRRGFVIASEPPTMPADAWWARVALEGATGMLFATDATSRGVAGWVPGLFGDADLMEYMDSGADVYRCAAFRDERLVGVLFVGPAAQRPQWDAVKALFAGEELGDASRRMLLSGQSLKGLADSGPVVCACFGVGLATIRDAIVSGATSPEAIGQALRAGTNCGSCVPELKRIIAAERPVVAG